MPKLIDADKLKEWLTNSSDASILWEGPEGLLKFDMFVEEIDAGTFDPTPPVHTAATAA